MDNDRNGENILDAVALQPVFLTLPIFKLLLIQFNPYLLTGNVKKSG